MNVRELINALLDMPPDAEVTYSVGGDRDPFANLVVESVEMAASYNHHDAKGRSRLRKTVVIR